MVFFTRKIDKFSCKDSSISSHDAAHGVSIETKVYSADTPVLNFSFREFYLLHESEAEKIFSVLLFESGSTLFAMRPVFRDIFDIGGTHRNRNPNPVIVFIQLQIALVWFVAFLIHNGLIKSREAKSIALKFWLPVNLAVCFPVLMATVVAAYRAECCLNSRSAQVTRELIKLGIEIIFSSAVFCSMN